MIILLSFATFKSYKDMYEFLYLLIEKKATLVIVDYDIHIDFSSKHNINLTYMNLIMQMYNYSLSHKDNVKSVKTYKKSGRKKGQKVKSIYDPYKQKIEELRELGLSLQKICNHIGVGTKQSLFNYIKKSL
jgi:DNA invertase Pin-like site-specific DNA recombinase